MSAKPLFILSRSRAYDRPSSLWYARSAREARTFPAHKDAKKPEFSAAV